MNLVTQEEVRQRQAQQASAETQVPVKTKMLKRISRVVGDQSLTADKGKKGRKLGQKLSKKQGGDRLSGKARGSREKTRSSIEERADMDFVMLPLNNSELSNTSIEGESDLSTSPNRAGYPPGGEGVMEEIGKQFMAISKPLTGSGKRGGQFRGPKVKRLGTAEQSSVPRRMRDPIGANLSRHLDQSNDSLSGSRSGLLPPLAVSRMSRHDGNVVMQELENTDGVKVPDMSDIFVTKSKTRIPLVDSFPNSASNSEPALEPMDMTPHSSLHRPSPPLVTSTPVPSPPSDAPSRPPTLSSPPPPPPLTPPPPSQSPSQGEEAEREEDEEKVVPPKPEECKRKSRTSQLLETMEEGEVETR